MGNSSGDSNFSFSKYDDEERPGYPADEPACALPYVMLTASMEKVNDGSEWKGPRRVILPADAASESKVLRTALDAIRLMPGSESFLFAHRVSLDPLRGGGGGVRSLAKKKVETAASCTYRAFAESMVIPLMRPSNIDLMVEDDSFLHSANEKDEKPEKAKIEDLVEMSPITIAYYKDGTMPVDEKKKANHSKDFQDDLHPFRGSKELVMSPKEQVMEKSGSHEVKAKEVSYTSEDKERGGGMGSPFSFPVEDQKELSFTELKHGMARWVELDTSQNKLAQQLDAAEEQEMFYGQTVPFQRYRAVVPPTLSSIPLEYPSGSPYSSETLWTHPVEGYKAKPSSSKCNTNEKMDSPNDEQKETQESDVMLEDKEGEQYFSFTSNGYPGMPIFPLPENAVGSDGALLDFFPGLLARRSRARNNVRHATNTFIDETFPSLANEVEEKKYFADVMKCVSYLQI